MAIVAATGFEIGLASTSGDPYVSVFSGSGAPASLNTNPTFVRTGAYSVRCNPASSGASQYVVIAGASPNYPHSAVYMATCPSVERVIFGTTGTGQINLRVQASGAIAVYNGTTLIGTSVATPFASPGWHWIGVRMVTGTSVVFLQIDGVNAVSGTATVTTQTHQWGFYSTEAVAADMYVDDVVVDDTGFIAPCKVDYCLPISDNTVTGVLRNNGGGTTLWDCVNNIPPAGVASASESAAGNVSLLFPSNVTCQYIVGLESYTTIGVGASDTVLAVQWLVRAGEDIATGTKNATVGPLTNPTVGGTTALVFGNDGGAHGDEPAGLWSNRIPTTWAVNPTVTLATSPTLQIDRVAQTRVGCIDFIGLLVVWQPVVVIPASLAIPNRRRNALITR